MSKSPSLSEAFPRRRADVEAVVVVAVVVSVAVAVAVGSTTATVWLPPP
jgi:hypothetical protein